MMVRKPQKKASEVEEDENEIEVPKPSPKNSDF
jgi:hypothetical protein